LGVPDETPILIVGMPRSGTTLMEQIVSSHAMVAGGDELLFWGGQDQVTLRPERMTAEIARRIASEYLEVLRGILPGSARVTDKMPFNYLALGLIHLVF